MHTYRLYGALLKELNMLSIGDYVAVMATELLGGASGEGTRITSELFDNNKGKVIFIDEAYNLDPMRNPYGAQGTQGFFSWYLHYTFTNYIPCYVGNCHFSRYQLLHH